MKLAIPDLISNSYFPALAAAELGFFAREGSTVSAELIFPVDRAYEALRDGEVDFVGGAAHGALAAFPEWRGVKLLGALAQGMYWFLVMRADLGIARGDLAASEGQADRRRALGRDGAAPSVDRRRPRSDARSDQDRPGAGRDRRHHQFRTDRGRGAERRQIDGFWANGMATEIAVTTGVGTIVLDVRRGDGPAGCFDYTLPVLATTDRTDRART